MEGTQTCYKCEINESGKEIGDHKKMIFFGHTFIYNNLNTGDTDDDKRSLSIIIGEILSCFWQNIESRDDYNSNLSDLSSLDNEEIREKVGKTMEDYLKSIGILMNKNKILDILTDLIKPNIDYLSTTKIYKTRKLLSYDEILEHIFENIDVADRKFIKRK
jgi:hypothetical protein